MAIPFNLADLIKATPANQVVDQNLVNARNMFGIDDDFLLKDYTDYYMDKPPVINTNEGIATLPVNTNVSNQGEGGEGRDDLSIFDIKNKAEAKTSTGGISDLQKQLSQGTGMQSIMDAYQNVKDNSGDNISFEQFMNQTAPFGRIGNLKPGNLDFSKPAYMEPRSIADQNRILGYTFSDPDKFTGITSLRDFLPGGKYSLTGMAVSGLKGINNAIQGSNFAKSTSLADYRDMMKYGGYEEREAARKKAEAEIAKRKAEAEAAKRQAEAEAVREQRQKEADRIKNTYKQQQQQIRDAGEGRGSRQGDSDIGDQRGGYATDDTAGFF